MYADEDRYENIGLEVRYVFMWRYSRVYSEVYRI